MKMVKIITAVCWCIVALVLIGFCGWVLTGTIFGHNVNFGFSGILSGGDGLVGEYLQVGEYSISAQGIDSLNIDWVSGEVSVTPYDGDEIKMTEYARRELKDGEQLKLRSSGGTVSVDYFERQRIMRINAPAKKLEVLVPRGLCENMNSLVVDVVSATVTVSGMNAGKFSIDTVSGRCDVSDITAQTFKMNSTSGSLTASSVNADKITVDTTSGRITFSETKARELSGDTTSGTQEYSGMFDIVNIDSVSGKISIDSAEIPSSLKTDTTSGSVTVTIPDGGEITVNHDSISGSFSSDIPVTMKNGSAQFRFSSTSGSVKIYKAAA